MPCAVRLEVSPCFLATPSKRVRLGALRFDLRRPLLYESFFSHYNHEHRHSGIGYHTPASVRYGTAHEVRAQRKRNLDAACATSPARFRHRRPDPPKLPTITWITEPVSEEELGQKAS